MTYSECISRKKAVRRSILSSRLKDKDGNPVLLEGIKDAEGNWVFKFDYDSEGVLKGYQMNLARESETVIFNGLSYTGTYKRSKKLLFMKPRLP